ncbi:MAG: hypothetical protein V1663_00725, partial [archaeon]
IIIIAIVLFFIVYYIIKINKARSKKYNNDEVKNAIRDALDKGYSKEEIERRFLESGWPKKIIEKILKEFP